MAWNNLDFLLLVFQPFYFFQNLLKIKMATVENCSLADRMDRVYEKREIVMLSG
jgi:hypothetical protein